MRKVTARGRAPNRQLRPVSRAVVAPAVHLLRPDALLTISASNIRPPVPGDFFCSGLAGRSAIGKVPENNPVPVGQNVGLFTHDRRPGEVPPVLGQVLPVEAIGAADNENGDDGDGKSECENAGDEHQSLADKAGDGQVEDDN